MAGSATAGLVDGPSTIAQLNTPGALALSVDERTLYICDTGNDAVRAWNMDAGVWLHWLEVLAGAVCNGRRAAAMHVEEASTRSAPSRSTSLHQIVETCSIICMCACVDFDVTPPRRCREHPGAVRVWADRPVRHRPGRHRE